ncbi:MAG: adenylate/guanylate cyclase domain-containing protein [Paracoccaceae bacterium]
MSATGFRPFAWLVKRPDHVPPDIIRYYVYWKILYVMAMIGHGYTIFAFASIGVTFMAWFNVGSTIVFGLALFLLLRGYYKAPYWIAISELVLHGVAAMLFVGPDAGFQNFTFMVVILLFIQPFYSWRVSAFGTVIILAIGGTGMNYVLTHGPIVQVPPEEMRINTVLSTITWPIYVLALVLPFVFYSARAEKELAEAYDESERLLLNILPAAIARRLKVSDEVIADEHEGVGVLFLDIVGFTAMSQRLSAAQVVTLLNDVIFAIDALVEQHGLEKIKTIGDAYMVAAGVPDPTPDAEARLVALAVDIQNKVAEFKVPDTGDPLSVRIGINSGPVVAGVIGHRKFVYDIWGDTVNLASRMESTGEAGRIQLPTDMATRLKDRFRFEPRGQVAVKGKGQIETSFVTST